MAVDSVLSRGDKVTPMSPWRCRRMKYKPSAFEFWILGFLFMFVFLGFVCCRPGPWGGYDEMTLFDFWYRCFGIVGFFGFAPLLTTQHWEMEVNRDIHSLSVTR